MKNKALETKLGEEIDALIESRKTLMLSSLDHNVEPYASYAPFARDDDQLYVLLSEIAVHGKNLAINPRASILIVEDEDTANELFARIRVTYKVNAELISDDSEGWEHGINVLSARHGKRINHLSEHSDFKLFRLTPDGGRYVKGFGKAYAIQGGTLAGTEMLHLREGHKRKDETRSVSEGASQ